MVPRFVLVQQSKVESIIVMEPFIQLAEAWLVKEGKSCAAEDFATSKTLIKPREDSESTAGGVKNKAFPPFPIDYRISATRKGR